MGRKQRASKTQCHHGAIRFSRRCGGSSTAEWKAAGPSATSPRLRSLSCLVLNHLNSIPTYTNNQRPKSTSNEALHRNPRITIFASRNLTDHILRGAARAANNSSCSETTTITIPLPCTSPKLLALSWHLEQADFLQARPRAEYSRLNMLLRQ